MHEKRDIVEEYGLSDYDAEVHHGVKKLADFFEDSLKYTKDAKAAANWMMGELLGYLNANSLELDDVQDHRRRTGRNDSPDRKRHDQQQDRQASVQGNGGNRRDPEQIVKGKGLCKSATKAQLLEVVDKVIADNPQSVADFKGGKDKAIGFLVGQVMKETKGKANPGIVNKLFKQRLNEE